MKPYQVFPPGQPQPTAASADPASPFNAANRDEWELMMFRRATHFTVARRRGPGHWDVKEFSHFSAAALDAIHDPRALLYAVGYYDISVPLPRKRWWEFLEEQRKQEGTKG